MYYGATSLAVPQSYAVSSQDLGQHKGLPGERREGFPDLSFPSSFPLMGNGFCCCRCCCRLLALACCSGVLHLGAGLRGGGVRGEGGGMVISGCCSGQLSCRLLIGHFSYLMYFCIQFFQAGKIRHIHAHTYRVQCITHTHTHTRSHMHTDTHTHTNCPS